MSQCPLNARNVHNHRPKCVRATTICVWAFTKHILIGQLGRHEKKKCPQYFVLSIFKTCYWFDCWGYGQLSENVLAHVTNINHETLFTPQISVLLLKCPEVNQHPPGWMICGQKTLFHWIPVPEASNHSG